MSLERITRIVQERLENRFFGKYEAVVTANDDPLVIGRVRAKVPAVLGEDVESGWALPCAAFGGGADRGFLVVPEVGDTIWIEFAGGLVERPIWAGAFWGAPSQTGGQDDLGTEAGSEVPSSEGKKAGPKKAVLRTAAGHRLFLDDDGGLFVLANGDDETQIHLTKGGEVVIKAKKIKLCKNAAESLVLGDKLMQLFNQHTHPTGVGPSGPPTPPMTASHLSTKVKTE